MPGNIVVKPIEANITRKTSAIGKMSPYYVVALGDSRQKGQVCKNGGKSPAWTDAVTVERTGDPFCVVELKTKRALLPDKTIGTCKIMVEEISEEKTSRWYDIFYKEKVAGKILIEANLMAGEAELVSQDRIQPLAAQSANALLEEREREVQAPVHENRNAVSLGDLPNKRDGYEVRVIEPEENHDVMQIPVMDPSMDPARASVELVENQGEEKKSNALAGLEDLKQTVKEVGHEVKEAVVQQRDSVLGDDYEVPEERTEEEGVQGVVKGELMPRQR